MLYAIQDETRDEMYITDHHDNAMAFLAERRATYPAHEVELWRQRLDGEWEQVKE